ncbi:hypothetical protein Tco_0783005, partial [Tanacetum coccineum]
MREKQSSSELHLKSRNLPSIKSGSTAPYSFIPHQFKLNAFKTYRAYATGEKAPKSKTTKKKTDPESSPKTKPSQASKGKRIKTSAKGDKSTSKSKGLTVLSEVAFSEAEQMQLATKRSLKEFHISHASGSGDGVDILSKVLDEQQQTESGTNKGVGDKLKVPDVPEYKSEKMTTKNLIRYSENDFVHPNLSTYKADEEEQEKEKEKAEDDDEEISDQKVSTPPDYELTEEDENQQDDDTMNVKRIIKEQVKSQTSKIMTKVEKYVIETMGAKVLVRSTNQPQVSYAVVSLLSELELKKILIDKMEENNSIDRFDVQKNLYRALLEAYNSDKDLLSSYGDVVTLKRGRDQDKDKEPFAGSKCGSKRQRSSKEESSKEATQKESQSTSSSKGTTRSPPKSSGKSVQEEEHDLRVDDLEEPFHQEFDTGNYDVSPVREATDVDERLWNPSGSRTPDREWNQTKMVDDRPPQQWMTKLAQHSGTCKSVVDLEYHLEEVFKATNDQLDWHNPKDRPYPHDLSKTLPLILDARGRLIIPYDHFINNDLEYLKGGSSSRKYTNSITKIKAADYGHIKWIEDKIPRSTWSEGKQTNLNVDERFALNVALI